VAAAERRVSEARLSVALQACEERLREQASEAERARRELTALVEIKQGESARLQSKVMPA
jgi:hypothetical protein